ncbi:MAG: hypothetical protein ACYC62_06375 [Coriobacteriia bacterium]
MATGIGVRDTEITEREREPLVVTRLAGKRDTLLVGSDRANAVAREPKRPAAVYRRSGGKRGQASLGSLPTRILEGCHAEIVFARFHLRYTALKQLTDASIGSVLDVSHCGLRIV